MPSIVQISLPGGKRGCCCKFVTPGLGLRPQFQASSQAPGPGDKEAGAAIVASMKSGVAIIVLGVLSGNWGRSDRDLRLIRSKSR
jgi:hypothetical protein